VIAREPERKRSFMNEKAADESGFASWLVCRAGTHLCAMALQHVAEVMRMLPIEPLAGAPHYVRGLCIIRGAPTPVVDTGSLMGDRATRPERLVAVKAGGRGVALAVEAVVGVRAIRAGASDQMPPLLRDAATETVAAIGILDAELLFFLRTARIVPEELLSRLDALETVT
jgi:purine-binding chemotaxis protein CheW